MENSLIEYLLSFGNISENEQIQIFSAFTKMSFKSGDRLTCAGEITKRLFFINKGILKITIPEDEISEITYYFLKEKQFISFLYSMYGNVPAEQSLQAACDTEVMMINKDDLYHLYEQLPYLKTMMSEISNLSMVNMVNLKNTYLSGNSSRKYSLFLKQEPEVALKIAQTDIASYLGITPQSLSRIRKNIR